MISFRYHIVSIVSVFLALAVGVALGGGPLKGEVDNTLVEQVEADRKKKAEFQAEIAALRSSDEFTDTFAATVAPGLIGQALEGRPVSLMVLPGAQETSVASVRDYIAQSGGTVGGTVRVGEDLIDVANKQLVDELGSQLLDGTPDLTVPDEATGYERIGALIARAIGTPEDAGAEIDESSESILSGLSTASLMSAEGELTTRGSLVLVIAGPGSSSRPGTATGEDRQGSSSILTSIAKAMDANTDGVVMAGPLPSARGEGPLNALRSDVVAAREVSSVDVLGRTAGQVVTVMALAEQARGESGHYGAVDAADGAMPGAVAPTS